METSLRSLRPPSLAIAGLGAFLALRELIRSALKFDLSGKVVFITGGSRGLGFVLAREFSRKGARVAICARDEEELKRAKKLATQFGCALETYVCDITQQEQVDETIQRVIIELGGIDVLVNNAGIIQVGPMETMTIEDYQQAMQVHFFGSLHTTLAVLPQMRHQKSGRIVTISSIGGKISVPHLLPYSASKFALTGFSEGLRAEVAKDGIRVLTVFPGLMRTGSPRNAQFKGQHRAEYAWFSVADSLPFLTMSAVRAARKIVRATEHGQAELILSLPAKLGAKANGLFTGFFSDLLGWVNRLLPSARDSGFELFIGKHSESKLSTSWLTTLTRKAALDNNEMN